MAGGPLLINCKVIVGGLDLSGDSNSVGLVHGAEMLDATTFVTVASGSTRRYIPGLKTFELTGNMFWNTGNTDSVLFSRVGIAGEVATVGLIGEAEGDRVFFCKGVRGAYNPASGEIGQLVTAQLDLKNSGSPLVRGSLMRGNLTPVTVTGNSVGLNLGSLASKRIYSALHILSPLTPGGGGEQIIGTIESDDAGGFGTPTTRLTHATMTEDGSDWQEATLGAGVTDNFWRAKWTISGGAPSFLIYWSFGFIG